MENNFFDKTTQEQLDILKDENFFEKNELKQIDSLRDKGFFNIELQERINFLEKTGIFHLDVNDDPPTIPLTLDKVDYLNKKLISRIKRQIAYGSAEKFLNKILREKQLIIKEIIGIENLKKLEGGAILTCNHFNPFDSFAIEKVYRDIGKNKKHKLYKIIREGNYTNFPGLYGFFFQNCDTLPLATSRNVMVEFLKAVDVILRRGDYILIYPEQSMWLNYKKPKKLRSGAFKLAVRSKVPVVPIFIGLEDSNIDDENGGKIQEYTIHIEKPIYPMENIPDKENVEYMKNKNYKIWKEIYEDFYKVPLEYKN